jgi:hypothetical protein
MRVAPTLWPLALALAACGAPLEQDADGDGVSAVQGDCDDAKASVFPGAPDTFGDGIDTSCDGVDGIDEDGDQIANLESGGVDCDDDDPTIRGPGTPDNAGDAVDQNCDGVDGTDGDGDGLPSVPTGGTDCDDRNPNVKPGAPEKCNGFNDDCDATTSEAGLVAVIGGGDYATVGDAVAASAAGDTVYVCAGAAPGRITIDHDLTIHGQGGPNEVSLGVDEGSLLTVTGGVVAIDGITLQGGTGTLVGPVRRGGVALVEGGTLTLDGTPIEGGTADEGGALWVGPGAAVALRDLTMSGARAQRGAAILLHGASLDAVAVTVEDAVAEESGAAIYADAADGAPSTVWVHPITLRSLTSDSASDGAIVDVHDSDLHWTGGGVSRARTNGAPVRVVDSDPTPAVDALITAATFDLNTASVGAGAVLAQGVDLTVDDVTFGENTGGRAALWLPDTRGSLTVTSSTFRGNHADLGAGGLESATDTLSVATSTFIGNGAVDGAGALSVTGDAPALSDLTVGNNRGSRAGGVWLAGFTTASLTRVRLTANFSDGVAGLLADSPTGALTLDDLNATDNEGGTAGAADLTVATTDVIGGIFDGNEASEGVAGIAVHRGRLSVDGAELLRHIGVTAGAFWLDHSTATVDNTHITSNQADLGPAVRQLGGALTLTECVVSSNEASVQGVVAVEPDGATSLTIDGGAFHLNLAPVGGGVWYGLDATAPGVDTLTLLDVDMGVDALENDVDDLAVGDPADVRWDLGEHTSLTCRPSQGTCVP